MAARAAPTAAAALGSLLCLHLCHPSMLVPAGMGLLGVCQSVASKRGGNCISCCSGTALLPAHRWHHRWCSRRRQGVGRGVQEGLEGAAAVVGRRGGGASPGCLRTVITLITAASTATGDARLVSVVAALLLVLLPLLLLCIRCRSLMLASCLCLCRTPRLLPLA